jgi:hypothetical protein
MIELNKATRRYDSSRGLFPPCGRTYANGEITHFLRDNGFLVKVPPTWRRCGRDAQAPWSDPGAVGRDCGGVLGAGGGVAGGVTLPLSGRQGAWSGAFLRRFGNPAG